LVLLKSLKVIWARTGVTPTVTSAAIAATTKILDIALFITPPFELRAGLSSRAFELTCERHKT
jgi:hypothetical protein